jgi:hypothetical protein
MHSFLTDVRIFLIHCNKYANDLAKKPFLYIPILNRFKYVLFFSVFFVLFAPGKRAFLLSRTENPLRANYSFTSMTIWLQNSGSRSAKIAHSFSRSKRLPSRLDRDQIRLLLSCYRKRL